jgi:hypothetical protein
LYLLYGCNQFTGCVPECRFYPDTGRIEDEVIRDREWEEDHRKRNAIVNIDIDSRAFHEFLNEF